MWHARVSGRWIVLCLVLTACSDQGVEATPSQKLVLDRDCDVRLGCTGQSKDLSVSVRMAAHRSALKPFKVSLSSTTGLEAVSVSLDMQDMSMGQNHYRLLRGDNGVWQTDVTLPVCASGRSDWIAVFELQAAGKHYQLIVPFTL